jgi:AraC family transcriptional regulator
MICLQSGQYFGNAVSTRRCGPLSITLSCYGAGTRLPPHCHQQAYLFVMLGGAFSERSLRRDTLCTRGWLIFNEAREAHEDQVLERGAEGLNIELPAAWLARLREARGPREPVVYRHAGPAITAVGALHGALRSRDGLFRLGVEEAVTRLLDSLGRFARSAGRSQARLFRVEELIRTRHPRQLALDALAAEAGVHPAHLCREFRRACGCTMTQYAARLRADAALAEVLRTDSPLATVAARTGFADQAHLTRAIRAYFGTTPGRLRCQRG